MLLYAMNTRKARTWCLDLARGAGETPTPGGTLAGEPALPSVYGLIVPLPRPGAVYIGATTQLKTRVSHHLSRARRDWARARGKGARGGTAARNSASAILQPVLERRCALLVVRLEVLPAGDAAALRCHELAWLVVATREALPLIRRRGPSVQWLGEPGPLRHAFNLARQRSWPTRWIAALTPLCLERALIAKASSRPGTGLSVGGRLRDTKVGRTSP